MRAVLLSSFGPPGRLVPADLPGPVAGPGQVVIDVRFASITFVETQIRAGRPPNPAMTPGLPVVPGNGVGGVVAEVGPGADPALAGRRVISTTGGSGGYAERVAVDTTRLIDVPDSLDLAGAVALLADGRTAVALTRAATIRAGETVLVEAAGGAVGSLLVQLARNAGARVVAASGGPRKVALTRDLGATTAVDYTQPGWARRVRAEAGGVDVVFDGVAGQIRDQALGLLLAGGRLLAYGGASGAFTPVPADEVTRRGITVIRGAPVTPAEMSGLTRSALAEAAAGRLRPVIGQTFPLDRAADAHAAIETRATIGKTLLLTPAGAANPDT